MESPRTHNRWLYVLVPEWAEQFLSPNFVQLVEKQPEVLIPPIYVYIMHRYQACCKYQACIHLMTFDRQSTGVANPESSILYSELREDSWGRTARNWPAAKLEKLVQKNGAISACNETFYKLKISATKTDQNIPILKFFQTNHTIQDLIGLEVMR